MTLKMRVGTWYLQLKENGQQQLTCQTQTQVVFCQYLRNIHRSVKILDHAHPG